jgi:hypothetical protein
MSRKYLRQLILLSADMIQDSLMRRQFLRPHQPLSAALGDVAAELAVSPDAVSQTLAWLDVEATRPIGRLRRTELTQLARSLHRHWRQATGKHPAVAIV